MKYTITLAHRKKMTDAVHSKGTIATAKLIALGTGGANGADIKEPLPTATKLNNEIMRKAYTSSKKISDSCYEYTMALAAEEQIGQPISEMALIDSEGDIICIMNFTTKIKDDIPESYSIRNRYE